MIQKVSFLVAFALFAGVQLFIFYRYSEYYNQKTCLTNDRPKMSETRHSKTFNQSTLSVFLSRNDSTTQTKWEVDFLLRLRKLLLWSVREVNLRIRGQECTQWWANPMTVTELQETKVSTNVTQYRLTFRIQPGHLAFQTVVDVHQFQDRRYSGGHDPPDLVLINAYRLDELPQYCGTVPASLRKICLCTEEVAAAEKVTQTVREKWNASDPELDTWPVSTSFMISDYLRFSRLDIYLKSPGNLSQFCGPALKLLIFVSSSPKNLKGRQGIRQTYGNSHFLQNYHAKLLFVFDRVPEEPLQLVGFNLQQKIDAEFAQFGDVIQASHAHNYHNLTLRDLSMFNWLVTLSQLESCPMPPLLIKTDDDYFINVPLALRVFAKNPGIQMMGAEYCYSPTVRATADYIAKYYTPRYIFPGIFYPIYLFGATWLLRTTILPMLLKASLTVPIIHMDDVYVTGLLMREIGLRPRNVLVFTTDRKAGICETKQWVNSYVENTEDFYRHWKYFQAPAPSNCSLEPVDLKVLPENC